MQQRRRYIRCLITFIDVFIIILVAGVSHSHAEDRLNSLRLYAGRLTTNRWLDLSQHPSKVSFADSYLTAVALTRQINSYWDKVSLEIEGQLVKHFNRQDHWEMNTLITARWEPFWWDAIIDTSAAFGVGPSWATEKPEVEIDSDGDTSQFLIYWMMELMFSRPTYPDIAFIARIHHRSGGYGLVADEGGANALACGIAYRF